MVYYKLHQLNAIQMYECAVQTLIAFGGRLYLPDTWNLTKLKDRREDVPGECVNVHKQLGCVGKGERRSGS